MTLTSGTRLGGYEIITLLGAGGMGEVYRARDSKLNRDVAIKVLLPAVANDPDRLARFKREAQVLASLNHPNIAHVHGLEDADGTHALVMELVEGPTLADRIARLRAPGASARQAGMPIDEALPIAKQIAEALEAAHEQGIVHRDLKPANIKVRDDGTVKVLDFGLAKALDDRDRSGRLQADLTQSPTITTPAMTQAGLILGTAAYMSPEQAKGRPVDKRSDIWSFGCVLYETLTGQRAFGGEDVSDTLAAVLRGDPDWAALPDDTPALIRIMLRRCLAKDRKERIGDIAAVLFVLREPAGVAASGETSVTPAVQPLWRRAIPITVSAIAAGAVVALALRSLAPSTPARALTRLSFALPDGQQFDPQVPPSGAPTPGRQLLAISPDGTEIVYVANERLFVRSLQELDARPIAGIEGSSTIAMPTFSSDSQSLVFYSAQSLKRINVGGGTPATICAVTNTPLGLSWAGDEILFADQTNGIMRVSQNGGTPEVLVASRGGEAIYGPQLLPGGKAVLFTTRPSLGGIGAVDWDKAQIVAQSLDSGQRTVLIEPGTDARYLPSGHIVYAVGGTLFAVPVDVNRSAVTGPAVPIIEGVRRAQVAFGDQAAAAQFSVSTTGSLIYVRGPASTSIGRNFDLAMIDRKGTVVERLNMPAGHYDTPRVSPDGNRVAFDVDDGKETAVWIYELSGMSSMRRLTFGGNNRFPIWSADGERVAFQSDRQGDRGIFSQHWDGTGRVDRLTTADKGAAHLPESWSPDGDTLLYSVNSASGYALWALSGRTGKTAPFGSVQSLQPANAVFSPDGHWIAYQSGEMGNEHIYVQPVPPTADLWQATKGNGHHPAWSPDGREIFYIPGQGRFAVINFITKPNVSFSDPTPIPRGFFENGPNAKRNADIMPDGQRFVGIVPSAENQVQSAFSHQIEVVLNWSEELNKRVPTR